MIKRILAVSAIGTVGVLGLTALPAGAGTHGPNSNLKEKNGVLKFSPKVLNVTYNPNSTKPCKAVKNYEYSMTNTTKTTETLIINGDTSQPITFAPKSTVYGCTGTGTVTYNVQGTDTNLTINSSPKS